jgi:succinoglycan biosynthesis transport protein ExoP
MDLQEYIGLGRRYWRSITATVLVTIALIAGFSLLQQPTWTARSSLFVAVESGGTAGELSQGANYAERQVKSFAEVAKSPYVLQPVIDQLGLDTTPQQLAGSLTISAPANTSVLAIVAERKDPQEAADLANRTADNLARSVEQLSPNGSNGERLVQATVIQQAIVPTVPTSPKPLQNLALGILIGAMLGIGQALLRDRLDTRIRTVADLAQVTSEPVIGIIAKHDSSADHTKTGYSATEEAFRTLRTNLGFIGLAGERRPSLVITSAVPGEGKTETSIRLAESLALAGERVLLIDADMRRPMVAERIGLEGAVGLSHVLSGQAHAWDLIQPGGEEGLDILPAGRIPPNPAELLTSEAMHTLLKEAESKYDYVLLDAPPLLPVTDAAVLAHRTGGAVVVARSGVVRRPELGAALATLDAAGGETVGIVLNNVSRVSGAAGVYSGHYYYHRLTPEGASPVAETTASLVPAATAMSDPGPMAPFPAPRNPEAAARPDVSAWKGKRGV